MPDNLVSQVQRNDSLVRRALYGWQSVGRYLCGTSCPEPVPGGGSHKGYCVRPFRMKKIPDYLIVAELNGELASGEVTESLQSLCDRGHATDEGAGDHFGAWVLPGRRMVLVTDPNNIPFDSLQEKSANLLRKQLAKWPQEQLTPVGPAKHADGKLMWGVIVIVDDRCVQIKMNRKGECGCCYRLTPAGIERAEREHDSSPTNAQLPARQSPDAGWAIKQPAMSWKPPERYVGTNEIVNDPRFRKNGKNPVQSTIQRWVDRDKREAEKTGARRVRIVRAPDTHENNYPEAWVTEQIERWNPRLSTNA